MRMWNRKYNGSKNSRPRQPKQPLPGVQAQTSNGGGATEEEIERERERNVGLECREWEKRREGEREWESPMSNFVGFRNRFRI